MIDDGEDGILSSYVWKSCDEIHSDLLKGEGVFWGSDTIERDSRLVSKVLVLLACCTSSNVIGDPCLHSCPPEVVLGLSESLIPPRVSCCGVVMHQCHQISFPHLCGFW